LLLDIRDDAINALLGITHGNMSYAAYTQLFNEFLRFLVNILQTTFNVFASSLD
jgi:hypothetical protein